MFMIQFSSRFGKGFVTSYQQRLIMQTPNYIANELRNKLWRYISNNGIGFLLHHAIANKLRNGKTEIVTSALDQILTQTLDVVDKTV